MRSILTSLQQGASGLFPTEIGVCAGQPQMLQRSLFWKWACKPTLADFLHTGRLAYLQVSKGLTNPTSCLPPRPSRLWLTQRDGFLPTQTP